MGLVEALTKPRITVSEQIVPVWESNFFGVGLRSRVRNIGGLKFWKNNHPRYEGTVLHYDQARQMYRNDGVNALGSGFAKPIINTQVSFIGAPTVSVEDELLNNYLNDCLNIYWVDELQQMWRDALRDSKTIVRISKPDVLDPLMTLEESSHCRIELIAPERVEIERNFQNKNVIDRAVIAHRMEFIVDDGDPAKGQDPTVEEHDVVEVITREDYRYFDQHTNTELYELARPNRWNFVPLLEVWNEWDTSLQGGQSELESVQPFIQAFHDVLTQSLQAHKYHSTPKAKFKIADIATFVKNNFPEAWDPTTGTIMQDAEINWSGREVMFFQSEEDGSFMEARSVLGDSKTLLEFLIDCICIASETPEWAFMRVDSGSANSDRNAQTVPFVKKIERKRRGFERYIQSLCKMALVIRNEIPIAPSVSWEIIRPDDQMITNQAFQQLVMGLEVAAQRGEISDETYRKMIRQFLPQMKSSAQEALDARKNIQPAVAGNQPISGAPAGANN